MSKYEEKCTGCSKPLKHWEHRVCEVCRTKFSLVDFNESIEDYAKDYDDYMVDKKTGPQGGPSPDKETVTKAVPATSMVGGFEEYFDRLYD